MKFHSRDYIEFLQSINHQDDEEKINHEEAEQYGLSEKNGQGRRVGGLGAHTGFSKLIDLYTSYPLELNWIGMEL